MGCKLNIKITKLIAKKLETKLFIYHKATNSDLNQLKLTNEELVCSVFQMRNSFLINNISKSFNLRREDDSRTNLKIWKL